MPRPPELVRILDRIRARQPREPRDQSTVAAFAKRIGVGKSTYFSWYGNGEAALPSPSTIRLIWARLEPELREEGISSEDELMALRDRVHNNRRRNRLSGGAVASAVVALFIPNLHNLAASCHPTTLRSGREPRVQLAARTGRRNRDRRGNGKGRPSA